MLKRFHLCEDMEIADSDKNSRIGIRRGYASEQTITPPKKGRPFFMFPCHRGT